MPKFTVVSDGMLVVWLAWPRSYMIQAKIKSILHEFDWTQIDLDIDQYFYSGTFAFQYVCSFFVQASIYHFSPKFPLVLFHNDWTWSDSIFIVTFCLFVKQWHSNCVGFIGCIPVNDLFLYFYLRTLKELKDIWYFHMILFILDPS